MFLLFLEIMKFLGVGLVGWHGGFPLWWFVREESFSLSNYVIPDWIGDPWSNLLVSMGGYARRNARAVDPRSSRG